LLHQVTPWKNFIGSNETFSINRGPKLVFKDIVYSTMKAEVVGLEVFTAM
jgi:hypothetical protein